MKWSITDWSVHKVTANHDAWKDDDDNNYSNINNNNNNNHKCKDDCPKALILSSYLKKKM